MQLILSKPIWMFRNFFQYTWCFQLMKMYVFRFFMQLNELHKYDFDFTSQFWFHCSTFFNKFMCVTFEDYYITIDEIRKRYNKKLTNIITNKSQFMPCRRFWNSLQFVVYKFVGWESFFFYMKEILIRCLEPSRMRKLR